MGKEFRDIAGKIDRSAIFAADLQMQELEKCGSRFQKAIGKYLLNLKIEFENVGKKLYKYHSSLGNNIFHSYSAEQEEEANKFLLQLSFLSAEFNRIFDLNIKAETLNITPSSPSTNSNAMHKLIEIGVSDNLQINADGFQTPPRRPVATSTDPSSIHSGRSAASAVSVCSVAYKAALTFKLSSPSSPSTNSNAVFSDTMHKLMEIGLSDDVQINAVGKFLLIKEFFQKYEVNNPDFNITEILKSADFSGFLKEKLLLSSIAQFINILISEYDRNFYRMLLEKIEKDCPAYLCPNLPTESDNLVRPVRVSLHERFAQAALSPAALTQARTPVRGALSPLQASDSLVKAASQVVADDWDDSDIADDAAATSDAPSSQLPEPTQDEKAEILFNCLVPLTEGIHRSQKQMDRVSMLSSVNIYFDPLLRYLEEQVAKRTEFQNHYQAKLTRLNAWINFIQNQLLQLNCHWNSSLMAHVKLMIKDPVLSQSTSGRSFGVTTVDLLEKAVDQLSTHPLESQQATRFMQKSVTDAIEKSPKGNYSALSTMFTPNSLVFVQYSVAGFQARHTAKPGVSVPEWRELAKTQSTAMTFVRETQKVYSDYQRRYALAVRLLSSLLDYLKGKMQEDSDGFYRKKYDHVLAVVGKLAEGKQKTVNALTELATNDEEKNPLARQSFWHISGKTESLRRAEKLKAQDNNEIAAQLDNVKKEEYTVPDLPPIYIAARA